MKIKFDAVDWMRSRRGRIDQEDRGLSWGERYQKALRILKDDPVLWTIVDQTEMPVHPQTMAVAESRDKSYGKAR
jgi:hypothetical protein